MKYKVGDKVRVRKNLEVGKIYGEFPFSDEMEKYKGKQAFIEEVYSDNYDLNIDVGNYCWTDEMLEPVNENVQNTEKSTVKNGQFTKEDLKFGDFVTLRNGDVLIYTGIAIMRNSEDMEFKIGLYDTDFRYMPIHNNENKDFAIMKIERLNPTFIGECLNLEDDKTKIRAIETLYERKEEILDEKEKKYLAGVIKPFKNRVKHIAKINNGTSQFIEVGIDNDSDLLFPDFKDNTMYKGMEIKKEYTLKELGL